MFSIGNPPLDDSKGVGGYAFRLVVPYLNPMSCASLSRTSTSLREIVAKTSNREGLAICKNKNYKHFYGKYFNILSQEAESNEPQRFFSEKSIKNINFIFQILYNNRGQNVSMDSLNEINQIAQHIIKTPCTPEKVKNLQSLIEEGLLLYVSTTNLPTNTLSNIVQYAENMGLFKLAEEVVSTNETDLVPGNERLYGNAMANAAIRYNREGNLKEYRKAAERSEHCSPKRKEQLKSLSQAHPTILFSSDSIDSSSEYVEFYESEDSDLSPGKSPDDSSEADSMISENLKTLANQYRFKPEAKVSFAAKIWKASNIPPSKDPVLSSHEAIKQSKADSRKGARTVSLEKIQNITLDAHSDDGLSNGLVFELEQEDLGHRLTSKTMVIASETTEGSVDAHHEQVVLPEHNIKEHADLFSSSEDETMGTYGR